MCIQHSGSYQHISILKHLGTARCHHRRLVVYWLNENWQPLVWKYESSALQDWPDSSEWMGPVNLRKPCVYTSVAENSVTLRKKEKAALRSDSSKSGWHPKVGLVKDGGCQPSMHGEWPLEHGRIPSITFCMVEITTALCGPDSDLFGRVGFIRFCDNWLSPTDHPMNTKGSFTRRSVKWEMGRR